MEKGFLSLQEKPCSGDRLLGLNNTEKTIWLQISWTGKPASRRKPSLAVTGGRPPMINLTSKDKWQLMMEKKKPVKAKGRWDTRSSRVHEETSTANRFMNVRNVVKIFLVVQTFTYTCELTGEKPYKCKEVRKPLLPLPILKDIQDLILKRVPLYVRMWKEFLMS